MAAVLEKEADKDKKVASESAALIANLKKAQNEAQKKMDCDFAEEAVPNSQNGKILFFCQKETGVQLRKRLEELEFDPNAEELCDAENPVINNYIANELNEEVIHIIEAFADVFDPNRCDWQGKNALVTAAKVHSADKVLLAILKLKKIRDINFGDNQNRTAFHYVCAYGKIELAVPLLMAGADIFAQDSKGRTALDYAKMTTKELKQILASIEIRHDRDIRAKHNKDRNFVPSGITVMDNILASQKAMQEFLQIKMAAQQPPQRLKTTIK
jgi:hypothetical protein